MGTITDDIILEAVLFLGTPSKKAIYNYVESYTGLSRDKVVSKTGEKLKNLVRYRILSRLTINGTDYFHFPDAIPCPATDTETNKKGQIREYIASLPAGSRFSVLDIQGKYGCSRWVAYDAIRDAPGLTKVKTIPPARHEYVKGAVI